MNALTLAVLLQVATPDPSAMCRDDPSLIGQRYIVGRIPFFSCFERRADCTLVQVRCNATEWAAILGLGYQANNPPGAPRRPEPKKLVR